MRADTLKGAPTNNTQILYTYGTHRICDPVETLHFIQPHFPQMGITRIADITGLDVVGIPVCVAVRPNSKSLAVSQGKGITLELAKASAAMETIELYHAENVDLPITTASYQQLKQKKQVCNPRSCNLLSNASYQDDLPLRWVEGIDLMSQHAVHVPYDLVHCSLLPNGDHTAVFPVGSNGLASGNHILEAISHGICEVIERDATRQWLSTIGTPDYQINCIDLDTVESTHNRHLLDQLASAGLATYVWQLPTPVNIPVFGCAILEQDDKPVWQSVGIFHGFGCHLSKEVAFARAVTEAVQSRLTYISGARDDLYRELYTVAQSPFLQRTWRRLLKRGEENTDFRTVPSLETDSLENDINVQLQQLRHAGIEQVLTVDLTKPDFNIAVARVIIPGMKNPNF